MEISAVIPAYNEGLHLSSVLQALIDVQQVQEIIVVSDGSTDNTVQIAQGFGVDTIVLEKNYGKGFAMKKGVEKAKGQGVLFLDADLIGMQTYHIKQLIIPVYEGYADMTVGVFQSGRGATDVAQKLAPCLSGQRLLKRYILEGLCEKDWETGFGIEMVITRNAKQNSSRIIEVPLFGVTHSMKEEKMGISKGLAARFKMYWEIAKEITR
ncbi:MAG: glycosyltransferase family 2 protein [Xylanivirga thermophila]|jgi:polyisoprenyl-phosphate glycosyltransferase|uniref:glycosyltransferase family 2 protein n=1 Tax=Xylanivirga thermophila TaxID=2496273 RepID=UPI00101C7DA7|nr:glycosyltransferase family 2 protein [Xylanivirga thermophila]